MINHIRLSGCTSPSLRKSLFQSFVLPIFTWLLPFFPFFTSKQQQDLTHFDYICWKRVLSCQFWSDSFFSFIANEPFLEDRCRLCWDKYFMALSDTIDGELLFEQTNLNVFRKAWIKKDIRVKGVFRSKRFVRHTSLLERIMHWCASTPFDESIPIFFLFLSTFSFLSSSF